MISCPCNSNTWIKAQFDEKCWKAKVGWPPLLQKVFVRCPGRDSIFGRESFLRVTILPTSGKLPISMPPHAHAHAFPFSYANPNSQNDAFKFHLRLVSSSHTISEKVTDQLIFKQQGISLCKLLEKLFWRTCLLSMLKIIRQLSVNIMVSAVCNFKISCNIYLTRWSCLCRLL